MIRVKQISPTPSYEAKVLLPGEAFLANNPTPSREQFNRNNYWRAIHDEMYLAYHGICMYCASWTPRTSKGGSFLQSSIDHFIPKGPYPKFAYRWENFRLCRNDINTKKATGLYVPDPFFVRNIWFTIDFATWRVGPSAKAPEYLRHRIRSTFVILGLNEDFYIEERVNAASIYVHRPLERPELRKLYPFLTGEIEKQSHGTDLLDILRSVLSVPEM